jgi:hypothetical protein
MNNLTCDDLIAIRTRYPHFHGLPLYEVAARHLAEYHYWRDSRLPTADELSSAMERSGLGAVVVFGVLYANFTEACRVNNIHAGTARGRAKAHGISRVEALEQIITDGLLLDKGEFHFRGVSHPSFTAACRAFRVDTGTVRNRQRSQNIGRAEALEQIIKDGLLKDKGEFNFRGITYSSFTAACRAFRVDTGTVRNRQRSQNIGRAEALEQIALNGFLKDIGQFEFRGVTYPNFTSACRAHDLRTKAVYNRMRKAGATKHEALEQVINECGSELRAGHGRK